MRCVSAAWGHRVHTDAVQTRSGSGIGPPSSYGLQTEALPRKVYNSARRFELVVEGSRLGIAQHKLDRAGSFAGRDKFRAHRTDSIGNLLCWCGSCHCEGHVDGKILSF